MGRELTGSGLVGSGSWALGSRALGSWAVGALMAGQPDCPPAACARPPVGLGPSVVWAHAPRQRRVTLPARQPVGWWAGSGTHARTVPTRAPRLMRW